MFSILIFGVKLKVYSKVFHARKSMPVLSIRLFSAGENFLIAVGCLFQLDDTEFQAVGRTFPAGPNMYMQHYLWLKIINKYSIRT